MNFKFLEELSEARLYRTVNNLRKATVGQLADNFFNAILAISVMHMIQPKVAQRYATNTIQIGSIDKWYMTSSDLHNLAYMLMYQDQFTEKLIKDRFATVPKLQYKQWLRNISQGNRDRPYERRFLLRLQRDLGISSSSMKTSRRIVADWESSTDDERKFAISKIFQHLRAEMQQADLFIDFRTSMIKKGELLIELPSTNGIPNAVTPGSLKFISHLPNKNM